mmetsp:Transcript_113297/g.316563  ORF Transcript_113297/g.316563 Transcript_113297/m.316563 type:complete len:315 (+) Transcript_113297:50-994(+)
MAALGDASGSSRASPGSAQLLTKSCSCARCPERERAGVSIGVFAAACARAAQPRPGSPRRPFDVAHGRGGGVLQDLGAAPGPGERAAYVVTLPVDAVARNAAAQGAGCGADETADDEAGAASRDGPERDGEAEGQQGEGCARCRTNGATRREARHGPAGAQGDRTAQGGGQGDLQGPLRRPAPRGPLEPRRPRRHALRGDRGAVPRDLRAAACEAEGARERQRGPGGEVQGHDDVAGRGTNALRAHASRYACSEAHGPHGHSQHRGQGHVDDLASEAQRGVGPRPVDTGDWACWSLSAAGREATDSLHILCARV